MPNGTALPSLHQPTIDLAVRAWRACTSAREAVRVATELVRASQTMREEWEQWRVLQEDRIAHPEYFLSRCMYCSRMRTPAHEWVPTPVGVGRLLQNQNVPYLSHGICPECLDMLMS